MSFSCEHHWVVDRKIYLLIIGSCVCDADYNLIGQGGMQDCTCMAYEPV
jgi:hypothetical protein